MAGFRLGQPRSDVQDLDINKFSRVGFNENPFPVTGVNARVTYTGHMSPQVGDINRWLAHVETASTRKADSKLTTRLSPIRPLAIRGSLGVGKTHLLQYLHDGLRDSRTPVLRVTLHERGMGRLLLSSHLLECLPTPPAGSRSATPLLAGVVDNLSNGPVSAVVDGLPDASVLKVPLSMIRQSATGRRLELTGILERWIRRSYTSPMERARVGLAGTLRDEGQAIGAVADLLTLARSADLIDTWYVFIDQLEELWRPNVFPATRRARFLTDVRFLVDKALEGAPIAALLAWNTETNLGNDDKLRDDYRALWQRLGAPVDIPGLKSDDLWPFANAYLASELERADPATRAVQIRFHEVLQLRTSEVLQLLRDDSEALLGSDRFTPRGVLKSWRWVAEAAAVGSQPIRH